MPVFLIGFEKKIWLLRFEPFVPLIFRESVKKYSGKTKKTFAISKSKTLNPLSPLNQCCKSMEGEKITNCICFDSQQHWLKMCGVGGGGRGETICPTIFLTDCSLIRICTNPMVLFSFFCFQQEILFVDKFFALFVKIVSFSRNLIPRVIPICRIQWCFSLFLFRPEILFWRKLVHKMKIVSFN